MIISQDDRAFNNFLGTTFTPLGTTRAYISPKKRKNSFFLPKIYGKKGESSKKSLVFSPFSFSREVINNGTAE